MENYTGTRVLILGAARQGTALARYLVQKGAVVTLNDIQSREKLLPAIQSLPGSEVNWVLGEHPLTLLDETDLVCISGGVPLSLPIVIEAIRRGIRVTNDSQIFMQAVKAPVVGITGSAGKTTTTSLIGRIAAADLKTPRTPWVGGNIGNPLIEFADDIKPEDLVILELSSFQLELMTTSPQVAVVLNITPNHLDRHASMEEYIQAKSNILAFQQSQDIAILNHEDPQSWQLRSMVRGSLVAFGIHEINADLPQVFLRNGVVTYRASGTESNLLLQTAIQLRGEHNLTNVLAACAIAAVLKINSFSISSAVSAFHGVKHRFEVVREFQGVTWINDSIATAPERTLAALRSISEPVVLLLGGRDKNLPWDELAKTIHQRVDHVVIFGEAGTKIIGALGETRPGSRLASISRFSTMNEALEKASEVARPGDVVLLSPGCTSYDAFKDFEERGNAYIEWVNRL
jgi:UDP-N-acetylmuramoylalanine--D-glutamate ligase